MSEVLEVKEVKEVAPDKENYSRADILKAIKLARYSILSTPKIVDLINSGAEHIYES
jgi:hypothetical protein